MNDIDVVIPCYNYGRFLHECVASVLSQRSVDVRILIIDDCSSDDTEAIGRELAALDSRVEYRRHAANRGHIETYNEGLMNWASSSSVALLSADDLLTPGSLARATTILTRHPNVGMVYGRALHFLRDTGNLDAFRDGDGKHTIWSGQYWLERVCHRGHNVITSPEVVVRTGVQKAVGGYRPELPHAGDLEMWLRIAAVSDIAYVRRIPQAYYRVHQASMMRTKYSSWISDLAQRKTAFDMFFQHHHDLPGIGRLRSLAGRTLSKEALWEACRAYDHDRVDGLDALGLERFAIATYSERLPELGALRRRRLIGPRLCNRTQLFSMSAAARKLQRWYLRERWERQGI